MCDLSVVHHQLTSIAVCQLWHSWCHPQPWGGPKCTSVPHTNLLKGNHPQFDGWLKIHALQRLVHVRGARVGGRVSTAFHMISVRTSCHAKMCQPCLCMDQSEKIVNSEVVHEIVLPQRTLYLDLDTTNVPQKVVHGLQYAANFPVCPFHSFLKGSVCNMETAAANIDKVYIIWVSWRDLSTFWIKNISHLVHPWRSEPCFLLADFQYSSHRLI